MARRKRKTLLGRKDRQKPSRRSGTTPVPRLGRRKALWRFVGAMALAPLSGVAFGQDGMMPGGMGAPPIYAPQGYPPVLGPVQAGYQGAGPGYVTPVQGTGPYVAPPPMVPQGAPGIAIPSGSVFTPRLVTNNGFGEGLGWDDGYTSIGAWLPLGLNDETTVLYLDAQGFVSYDESGGGNFTLGYRYYMPSFDRFVGVYGAFDIDAGNANSTSFNRFAVGAESVGRYLTYRVNGYIPTETDGKNVANGIVGDPFFRGNNILFLDRTLTRYQYGGVDGEVGGPLPLVGKYGMSGFLGGYYLTSDVDDTVGFQGRLEANINDDLQIGGKLTTDDIFDTNMWVTMTLRSPKGSWANFFRKDWLRPPSVQTQMDRSAERSTRIATDLKTFDSEVLAINPLDGLPYLVLHVNPDGGSGPGTFENPAGAINGFNNGAFDIVYVQPGTLVTNGPIQLFDNQRLLSTSVPHLFDTQRGTFRLPGFVAGPLPLLQNRAATPSSVVMLANNNEVSGFRIDGTGGFDVLANEQVFHAGIIGSGISSFNINRNVMTNVTSGVQIVHTGPGTGFITDNTLVGMGFGSSFGASVAAINASALDLTIRRNAISGFLGEDANATGSLDPGEDLNRNFEIDPGIGINVAADGGSVIDADISRNSVGSNDTGLRLAATAGSLLTADVAANAIIGNLSSGAVIEADTSHVEATFTANTIAANGGPGIDATATGASDLTLIVGGPTIFDGNLIDANAGAGIAMTVGGVSIARTTILNNQISNTIDDGTALTRFSGEGINILAGDNGSLLDSVIDQNQIFGNVSDGIRFTGQGLSTTRNILVGNLDGDNNNGNVITGNFNGINTIRTGSARFDEFQIVDNEIFSNVANGIDFFISGGLLDVPDFVVRHNNLTTNGLDGVHGLTLGNGILNLALLDNVITANTIDGVRIDQNRFTIDQGGVTGTWTGNLIADNLVHGIDIQAPMLDLIVGTTDVGNLITRNGNIGVLLLGPGRTTFTNNTISQNGALNNDVTLGAGIDIEGVGFKDFLFVNNRVIDNFGDGVEIEVGLDNGFDQSFVLNFVDNVVARNQGRGYDVLNKSDSLLDLTIRGTELGRSVIAENQREGIYVVNTASAGQTQQGATPVVGNPSNDPTHGMATDGEFFNGSFMTLTVQNNMIVGNGIEQTSTVGLETDAVGGSGLVLRVGTGDGGYGFTDDGAFASSGRAGVIADVTGNFMSGNFGADLYAESFTSTGDPPGTTSTWNGTEFDLDNYDGDPLARLDLNFVNNTFEEIDVNNLGAFYDNAEGTFKSRTFGRTAPDPNGPFRDADRRRNSQRVAYRDETLPSTRFPVGQLENDGGFYDLNPQPGDPPNPGFGPEDRFLYAGMGESTFRISTATVFGNNVLLNEDGTTTVIPASLFFAVDGQPYNDVFDANGVFLINSIFGEQPYGWSTF